MLYADSGVWVTSPLLTAFFIGTTARTACTFVTDLSNHAGFVISTHFDGHGVWLWFGLAPVSCTVDNACAVETNCPLWTGIFGTALAWQDVLVDACTREAYLVDWA